MQTIRNSQRENVYTLPEDNSVINNLAIKHQIVIVLQEQVTGWYDSTEQPIYQYQTAHTAANTVYFDNV